MANTIRIKRRASGGAAGAPSLLNNAELAFNEVDNILYYGNGTGGAGGTATTIDAIGGKGAYLNLTATQTASGTYTFSNAISGTIAHATSLAVGALNQVPYQSGPGTTAYIAAPTTSSTYLSWNGSAFAWAAVSAGGGGTVSSVGGTGTVSGLSLSGTVTSTGNLTLGGTLAVLPSNFANQATNTVLAAPDGSTGAPTFRTLAVGDIPTLTTAKISDFATTAQGYRLDQFAVPTGPVALNAQKITGLADPTAAQDAVTKIYVDNLAAGLHIHAPARVASTTTLATMSGGSVTYANGTLGFGATLTLGTALSVIDGVTLANGDRVLIKNESTQAWNGNYIWSTGGTVLTRAVDDDVAADLAGGDFTFIQEGTLQADTGWVQTTKVVTVGTDPVVWSQFSGAGTYTAGTGLSLTGSTFSITDTTVAPASYGTAASVVTLTVNAKGQLTTAATTAIAIANTQVSGLGTMSTQAASSVAITGGSISGLTTFDTITIDCGTF